MEAIGLTGSLTLYKNMQVWLSALQQASLLLLKADRWRWICISSHSYLRVSVFKTLWTNVFFNRDDTQNETAILMPAHTQDRRFCSRCSFLRKHSLHCSKRTSTESVKQGDLSGPYLVACAMYSEKLPGVISQSSVKIPLRCLRKNID